MGPCPHGVDLSGNYCTAISMYIHVKHETDKPRFRLIGLQRGAAVNGDFFVSIGGVGHVASILDRPLEAAPETLIDELVFPAAHKRLELRKLIVYLV